MTMRTSSKSTPCATSHRTASRRSRAIAPGDGLERAAVLGPGPRLDFADHQHLALGRHDVDLAFRATPVAVEDP
jgi:hypothetical protein